MSDEIEVIAPAEPSADTPAVETPIVAEQAEPSDVAPEVAPEIVPEPEPEAEPTPVPPMERIEIGSLIERTPRGWMAHLMYGGARRLHGEGDTIEAAVAAAFGVVAE